MARTNELLAQGLQPSLKAAAPDLFSEIAEFWNFIREELRPFPGRGYAVARLVVAAVVTVIISETLRIPNPAFSAYLIFFIANEDGISSVKLGLLALVGLTIALIAATGVSICFMDAPWFRLPVTFLLIASAIWLSRTLVLAVMGRLMAIVLVLYLSLADTIFDPEALTEATLWLWSIVGLAIGVSAITSLLLEPRPDLLLRQQIETSLGSVQHLLESIAEGRADRLSQARVLRRELYGSPLRMRQLLARWRQRLWPALSNEIDWELGIFIVERLLSISAALAISDKLASGEEARLAVAEAARTVGEFKQAVHDRNPNAIRSLTPPSMDDLPDSIDKSGLIELAAALSDARLILTPFATPAEASYPEKAEPPKRQLLVPDALTNPDYTHFTIKTILAILACEIFMNAVDWPGIRTSMITCVVTAMATVGAQRQKQLLRLTGAGVGGLMGLGAIIFIVPQMDTIVGLSLLVTAGTAACAWVAAGSVRSSYAGFQMALAFFIMLLPGFVTSIDLSAIRDRFVGILVGITAMWIFFDHLWHTSSRRQLVNQLVSILRLMAKAPTVISSTMSPLEARRKVTSFRRELYNELSSGRHFLDETKIELTLALTPRTIGGVQLEILANETSFAGCLLLALNEKKLRALTVEHPNSIQPELAAADQALAQSFTDLADAFQQFNDSVSDLKNIPVIQADLAPTSSNPVSLPVANSTGFELQSVYQALQDSVRRISELNWIVRALP